MKLYKLNVAGTKENFKVSYTESTNFVSYNDSGLTGSEQEKYDEFLRDLAKNPGPQPINIKMKLSTQSVDRALARAEVLNIKDVRVFVDRLSK